MKHFKKVLLITMLMIIVIGCIEPLSYARTIKRVSKSYNPNEQEEWVLEAIDKLEIVQTIAATISFVLIIWGCIQFAKYHKLKSSDQTEISEDEINRGQKAGIDKIKYAIYISLAIYLLRMILGVVFIKY